MWGIIPAAGKGSRIQPLAFSKELLPVGGQNEDGLERPRAVSDYLVERLVIGGATRICFVIGPAKSDIVEYYGAAAHFARICYVVQPEPAGLCDAIFRAVPFIAPSELVMIGLPDTIWFPEDGLRRLPDECLSFLLFPVDRPELFDAVETNAGGSVTRIFVKQPGAPSKWVWGAFKMPGFILHELFELWCERDCQDEYMGTLVNAFLAKGGRAQAVRAGTSYTDVGTLQGYRTAMLSLGGARV